MRSKDSDWFVGERPGRRSDTDPIRPWADAGMAKCSAHEYRLICRKHVRAAPRAGNAGLIELQLKLWDTSMEAAFEPAKLGEGIRNCSHL